jgi:hypothetical protein
MKPYGTFGVRDFTSLIEYRVGDSLLANLRAQPVL